ncbi:MAG: hypothetical protein ACOWW1_04740 [archaeon]|nr:hypothetical protein [Candidatus Bathyarchaeum sp.]
MPKKSPTVICPNPKCGKEIEDSIMLNVLSVDPPKQYEACPYCFIDLTKEKVKETPKKPEPQIEEVKESGSKMFDRVKSLIPNRTKIEEIQEKPTFTREKPEDKKPEKSKKKDDKSSDKDKKSGCPEHFGYLANRPSDVAIPQACLTCPKMVDCMLSPKD